jgi:hypothetical protein
MAYDVMNGILPIAAMPLATDAMFCSATPSSTKRSGNFFLNGSACALSVRSAAEDDDARVGLSGADESLAEARTNRDLFDVLVEQLRIQRRAETSE